MGRLRATASYTSDSRIALTAAADADFPTLWERMARTSFTMYQSYLGLPGNPVEWNDRYVFSNLTRHHRPPRRITVQPTPQGDDTGWNDDSEVPDTEAAKAGVAQPARFYDTATS